MVFWSNFWSNASHGQDWVYGPKTILKLLVHVLTTAPRPQLIAQNRLYKSFGPEPLLIRAQMPVECLDAVYVVLKHKKLENSIKSP